MSWNVISNGDGLVLLNGEDTIVRGNKMVKDELIVEILLNVEEMGVPIELTKGLKEIYFTYLKGNLEATYLDGKIIVSCNRKHVKEAHLSFIHELGHHIDEREAFTDMEELVNEWTSLSGTFEEYHVDIAKDNGLEEYFAIGFEAYYSGLIDLSEHKFLRKCVEWAHSGIK